MIDQIFREELNTRIVNKFLGYNSRQQTSIINIKNTSIQGKQIICFLRFPKKYAVKFNQSASKRLNSITYKNPYGGLYNWYAVNTNKLAPIGWHIPTKEEWTCSVTFTMDYSFLYSDEMTWGFSVRCIRD